MPDNKSAVVTLLWLLGCVTLFALQVPVLLSAMLGYDWPWLLSALDGSRAKLIVALLLGTMAVCLSLTALTIARLYYPYMRYDQFVTLVGHLTGAATLFIVECLALAIWGFMQLSGAVENHGFVSNTLIGKVVFLIAGTGPFLVWFLQSQRSQDAWLSMTDGRKPRLAEYRPYILIHAWVGPIFVGLMLVILLVLLGIMLLTRKPSSTQERETLNGHTTILMSVACTSDGKTLASASQDKMVKVWSLLRARNAARSEDPAWSCPSSPLTIPGRGNDQVPDRS